MEKSAFEIMGGTYRKEGDYLLPNLTPPESVPVGIWGQRQRHYLKIQRRSIYNARLLSGKLNEHLFEIDQQAEKMFFQLVKSMVECEGISKQLKTDRQVEWVEYMNIIHNRFPLHSAILP